MMGDSCLPNTERITVESRTWTRLGDLELWVWHTAPNAIELPIKDGVVQLDTGTSAGWRLATENPMDRKFTMIMTLNQVEQAVLSPEFMWAAEALVRGYRVIGEPTVEKLPPSIPVRPYWSYVVSGRVAMLDAVALVKPPRDWELLTRTFVMDPDGWRARRGGVVKPYSQPITLEEFQQRAAESTVRPLLDGELIPEDCIFTHSHTRHWCGNPRCRDA